MRWNQAQLQTLVDFYGKMAGNELATMIGCNINALRSQAARLGLTQKIVNKKKLDFTFRNKEAGPNEPAPF
jgi:hypothetical protein